MRWRELTLAVGLGASALVVGAPAPEPAHAVVASSAGEFTAVTPARILDTRKGIGAPQAPLAAAASIDVAVLGVGGVPTIGVDAVVLNVTAVKASEATFVTLWPTGGSMPVVSTLNPGGAMAVANMAVVPVGTDGKVSAYNERGSVHLLFDVVGFYSTASGPAGSRFHAVNPFRAVDTRNGTGGIAKRSLAPGASLRFDFRNRGSLPATGMTALVLNVTAVKPTADGYLTVFPGDVARPSTSSVNFPAGQVVPNLVTVRVPATGVVEFYNASGSTHLVVDVVGYYDNVRNGDSGRFATVPPKRSWDTRDENHPLGPGDVDAFEVAGFDGIPLGVGAVALTVTAVQPSAAGYFTVFPDDVCTVPNVSSLNFSAGQNVPNMVITRVSTAATECSLGLGRVDIYNPNGTTHLLIDVAGYFMA